jgi:hypothetical protein
MASTPSSQAPFSKKVKRGTLMSISEVSANYVATSPLPYTTISASHPDNGMPANDFILPNDESQHFSATFLNGVNSNDPTFGAHLCMTVWPYCSYALRACSHDSSGVRYATAIPNFAGNLRTSRSALTADDSNSCTRNLTTPLPTALAVATPRHPRKPQLHRRCWQLHLDWCPRQQRRDFRTPRHHHSHDQGCSYLQRQRRYVHGRHPQCGHSQCRCRSRPRSYRRQHCRVWSTRPLHPNG